VFQSGLVLLGFGLIKNKEMAIDQLENNLTNLNAEVLREMKLGLSMSLLSSWCRLKIASSQLPPPVSSRAVSCHRGLPLCRGTLRYSS
jgi:hypothetical protein